MGAGADTSDLQNISPFQDLSSLSPPQILEKVHKDTVTSVTIVFDEETKQ